MIYAESSVLVSLLLHDANTARALQLVSNFEPRFVFHDLLRLEIINAIHLNLAQGTIDTMAAARGEKQMQHFIDHGHWTREEPIWERVFLRAVGLSRANSVQFRTRSFDIAHVAAAMELGIKEFWSFDKRQLKLAKSVGLNTPTARSF